MAGSGAAGHHRLRRDKTEVSCCLKYVLFSFNVFFWLLGVGIMAIGLWAWAEKEMFKNIGEITEIFLDPGLVLIIAGAVIFIIGFAGCVGALRENTCLLMFFMVTLIIILLAQITAAVLLFIYKDWVTEKVTVALQSYIVKYRDDADLQNIIDWIQDTWLKCCGIEGPDDWNSNAYFDCNSPSREKCGVPFSCCVVEDPEAVINLQCGYDVRNDQLPLREKMSDYIYTQGCISAVEDWIDANMIPVAGAAVGVAVVEILGICFAHNLRQDVFAQKAKWLRR